MALRAFQLLLAVALCGLAGCVQPGPAHAPQAGPSGIPRVAILLPLSGRNAALGHQMLNAAQLALRPGDLQLDVRDTRGTPEGATEAAAASVQEHDTLILGPLTSEETAAASRVAQGIPMLAFTSDPAQARPSVWVLGVTPEQQSTRLVQALHREGKTRIAAVLPDNPFGTALAEGLNSASAALSAPAPTVRRYANGQSAALVDALRDVSGRTQGAAGAAPPFDALMLAETGPALREAVAALPGDGVSPPTVRLIGPATWARARQDLAGASGAWYAAPDPAARLPLERAYQRRYGSAPPSLADLAFDAASLAGLVSAQPGTLTQPQGFAGADGVFALLPNGRVRRGLAVFEVGPGGVHIVDPAPAAFGPGA